MMCKYSNMVFLFHSLTNCIIIGSSFMRSRAVAPPTRIDLALIFSGRKPYLVPNSVSYCFTFFIVVLLVCRWCLRQCSIIMGRGFTWYGAGPAMD